MPMARRIAIFISKKVRQKAIIQEYCCFLFAKLIDKLPIRRVL